MGYEARWGEPQLLGDERALPDTGAMLDDGDPVVIDCDRCAVRGSGCADCVVSVLLGGPPADVRLDDAEQQAIDVLAAAGLVPPLRMATSRDNPEVVTAAPRRLVAGGDGADS